ENRKLLVKDLKGSILVGYERFALGNFGLDTEDQKEIQTAVAGFNLKVKQLVKHEREAATKKLVKAADISPNELWDGINGRCIFKVPAESFVDAKGKHRWRGGGQLLVEVTEREIIPVSAVGAIESLVKGMVEKGVRLQRHTIKWDTPPGDNPKSFDRVMDGVMRTHDFTVQDAEKYVNQMKTLWHLIIRAYNASDAEAGIVETLEDFHHRVESDTNGITPQQFFGLNGSPDPQDGLACLKFEGAFRRDNKDDVYSLFFLAKRTLKEGRSSIEVIEVPEHVNDFLGKYVGKEYSEGDDFRELPADLGRVVRAIRGQEEMAAELSK
ncbi:MAG: hypothetical protein NTV36_01610, partial [Candidatus Staskawiczbacteria bacterium]|nr:hypothetical protein [Candidatus Staskawiczbacteria bacterium]